MTKTLNLLIVFILFAGPLVEAQGEPPVTDVYSVQGNCASQGQYTAQALENLRKVRDVLNKLKDNPACKGLSSTMNATFDQLATNVEQIRAGNQSQDGMQAQRMASLPNEIMSLRSFAKQPSYMQGAAMGLLVNSQLTSERLKTVAQGGKDIENQLTPQDAQNIISQTKRLKSVASTSLDMVGSVMQSVLDANKDCLDAPTGAAAVSAMANLAAVYSNQGPTAIGTKAAKVVNQIVTYMTRDKKYIDGIRKLNSREFVSSISCLIETTSEGFCAAGDARLLLDSVIDTYQLKEYKVQTGLKDAKGNPAVETRVEATTNNFTSLLKKGALAGNYILATQVPMVTDWLTKVQFGTEPQLSAEAQFKIQTFNNGNSPVTIYWDIMSQFNMKWAQLRNTTSLASKQNTVLEMLRIVWSGFGNTPEGLSENFFTRVHQPIRLPFVLMGMKYEEMPEVVFKPKVGSFPMSADQYLNINFQNLPQFQDPDQLAQVIKKNADEIYSKATTLANQYFLTFFIPDELAVVSESMVGMNKGDVRSGLARMDEYLADFIDRMAQPGGDPSMISLAQDTRSRIGKLLAHYKRLHETALQMVADKQAHKLDDKAFTTMISKQSREFLADVYDQFNVKLMRAAFISNRMLLIVKKDYTLAMQKRGQMNQKTEELLLATGLDSLQQIFSSAGLNLATAKQDLSSAQNIYFESLKALEPVIRDELIKGINYNRILSDEKILTAWDQWKDANKHTFMRFASQTPGDESLTVTRYLKGFFNNIWTSMVPGANDGEYMFPTVGRQLSILTGEKMLPNISAPNLEAAASERAKLCTQTLAFFDLRPYWYVCHDSTLWSVFYNAKKYENNSNLTDLAKNYLSVPYAQKAYEGLERKGSEVTYTKSTMANNLNGRICALREHYRRNYVVQLTAGLRRETEPYVNDYSTIPDHTPPPEVVTSPNSNVKGISGGAAAASGDDSEEETDSPAKAAPAVKGASSAAAAAKHK
jgi:hypothetical protein